MQPHENCTQRLAMGELVARRLVQRQLRTLNGYHPAPCRLCNRMVLMYLAPAHPFTTRRYRAAPNHRTALINSQYNHPCSLPSTTHTEIVRQETGDSIQILDCCRASMLTWNRLLTEPGTTSL